MLNCPPHYRNSLTDRPIRENIFPQFTSHFPTLSRETIRKQNKNQTPISSLINGRLVPTPQRPPRLNRKTPRQPILPTQQAPFTIRLLLMAVLHFRPPSPPPPLAFPPKRRIHHHPSIHLRFPPIQTHHIPHHPSHR